MKRFLLTLLAILIALPLGALAAVHFLLDGDAVRAQAANAVRRSTGRELVIAGPIRLAWSLTPAIEARDVSLLNPPGMSRAATAHVDRVEAEVALLPLLERRVEVRRIVLAGADVLLERDALAMTDGESDAFDRGPGDGGSVRAGVEPNEACSRRGPDERRALTSGRNER